MLLLAALLTGCIEIPVVAVGTTTVVGFSTRITEVVPISRPFSEFAQALASRADVLDARVRQHGQSRLVLVVKVSGSKGVVDIVDQGNSVRVKATHPGDARTDIAHRVQRVLREIDTVAGQTAVPPAVPEAAPAEVAPTAPPVAPAPAPAAPVPTPRMAPPASAPPAPPPVAPAPAPTTPRFLPPAPPPPKVPKGLPDSRK